jgi:hypothetical protein
LFLTLSAPDASGLPGFEVKGDVLFNISPPDRLSLRVVPRRVVYESCSRKASICAQLITAESLAG